VDATQVESAAGLVDDTGVAAAAKRRRARAYSSLAAAADAADASTATTETVATESTAPASDVGAGLELSDRVNDQLATQRVDEPSAKPRRNRRKKPAVAAEAEQPVESIADAAPAAVEADQAEATAEADSAKATNGTKKRRSRRKKTTEDSPAGESETGGE
jgi:hypothetical protein